MEVEGAEDRVLGAAEWGSKEEGFRGEAGRLGGRKEWRR